VNFIVDADIAKFFDTVSHERLVRFLEHRIGDPRILRLIQKWLKAGVLEDGRIVVQGQGTGQGAAISPLLANIYLHYALDLWAARWRRREARGDMVIVRYADDAVFGFESETDARRFLEAMRERLATFALALHPDKTRLIAFGRRAAADRARGGLGKASTGSAGDLQFPRLHLHLRQIAKGRLPAEAQEPARPRAGEVAGNQGRAARSSCTSRRLDRANGSAGWSRAGSMTMPRPQTRARSARSASMSSTSGDARFGGAARNTARPGGGSKRSPTSGCLRRKILRPWPQSRFAVKHPRQEPGAGCERKLE